METSEVCSSCDGSDKCSLCGGEGYRRYGSGKGLTTLGCTSCDQPYAYPDYPNEGNGRCSMCHGADVVQANG